MSLIKCSECGHQVSDKAAACPNCGNPMAIPAVSKEVRTIQQTAKKYKAMQLIGFLIIIIGLLIAVTNQQNIANMIGVGVIVLGGIVVVISKMLAWWNNG